jgi:hypothetical protein
VTGTVLIAFVALRHPVTVLFWVVVALVKASPLMVVAVTGWAGAPWHPVLDQLRVARPVIPARGAA